MDQFEELGLNIIMFNDTRGIKCSGKHCTARCAFYISGYISGYRYEACAWHTVLKNLSTTNQNVGGGKVTPRKALRLFKTPMRNLVCRTGQCKDCIFMLYRSACLKAIVTNRW